MKKGLHIENVIDFESAKRAYLAKLGKKATQEKKSRQKKAKDDDPFDWERIRSIKVVCRDKR